MMTTYMTGIPKHSQCAKKPLTTTFIKGNRNMINLLTLLLITAFVIQYITQSTTTLRRVNTMSRIRTGRLSSRDVVAISHQQYSVDHWLYSMDAEYSDMSGRFYLSANGRIYKRIRIKGHTSVQYYSRLDAIVYLQVIRQAQVTTRTSSNWIVYRVANACL